MTNVRTLCLGVALFEGLPVKRLYKDRVTFVFQSEEEFIGALRQIIERYDFNR